MLTIEQQRNVLIGVSAALLCVNIWFAVAVSKQDQMIVMVPTIDRQMTVGQDFVSEEYLLYRAEQVMQLLFNIRQENFAYNVEQILRQVSSDNKPEFNKQLSAFADDVKTKRYFYVFSKDGFTVDSRNLKITFSGYLDTFVNDKRLSTNHKSYCLTFSNKSGLVTLISFEELDDKS